MLRRLKIKNFMAGSGIGTFIEWVLKGYPLRQRHETRGLYCIPLLESCLGFLVLNSHPHIHPVTFIVCKEVSILDKQMFMVSCVTVNQHVIHPLGSLL